MESWMMTYSRRARDHVFFGGCLINGQQWIVDDRWYWYAPKIRLLLAVVAQRCRWIQLHLGIKHEILRQITRFQLGQDFVSDSSVTGPQLAGRRCWCGRRSHSFASVRASAIQKSGSNSHDLQDSGSHWRRCAVPFPQQMLWIIDSWNILASISLCFWAVMRSCLTTRSQQRVPLEESLLTDFNCWKRQNRGSIPTYKWKTSCKNIWDLPSVVGFQGTHFFHMTCIRYYQILLHRSMSTMSAIQKSFPQVTGSFPTSNDQPIGWVLGVPIHGYGYTMSHTLLKILINDQIHQTYQASHISDISNTCINHHICKTYQPVAYPDYFGQPCVGSVHGNRTSECLAGGQGCADCWESQAARQWLIVLPNWWYNLGW